MPSCDFVPAAVAPDSRAALVLLKQQINVCIEVVSEAVSQMWSEGVWITYFVNDFFCILHDGVIQHNLTPQHSFDTNIALQCKTNTGFLRRKCDLFQ